MLQSLSPTSKVSVSAFSLLVIVASVFSSAVTIRQMVYPDRAFPGEDHTVFAENTVGEAEVAGVADNRLSGSVPVMQNLKSVENPVKVMVTEQSDNQADVVLRAQSLVQVSSFDLTFFIRGNLEVSDISCSEAVACSSIEISQSSVRIIGERLRGESEELWSGELPVCTISYRLSQDSAFEINSPQTKISEVFEFGTERNLLESTYRLYPLKPLK